MSSRSTSRWGMRPKTWSQPRWSTRQHSPQESAQPCPCDLGAAHLQAAAGRLPLSSDQTCERREAAPTLRVPERHLRCECRNGTYAASAGTAPTLRVPERHLRCECRNGTYAASAETAPICECRNGTYLRVPKRHLSASAETAPICECRNGTYLRVPKRHLHDRRGPSSRHPLARLNAATESSGTGRGFRFGLGSFAIPMAGQAVPGHDRNGPTAAECCYVKHPAQQGQRQE